MNFDPKIPNGAQEPAVTPVPQMPPQEGTESVPPMAQAPAEEETLQFSSAMPETPAREPLVSVPPRVCEYSASPAPKKPKTGWKVLAFALAAALILSLGVFGGFLLKGITDQEPPKEESPAVKTEENQQTDTVPVIPPADKEPVFLPDEESTETMNPKEIYANNVNSIVGITLEGQMYNIFGSVSAYASSGTGFILDEKGYILTNYHVVEGDSSVTKPKITVSLYNGETYPATVVGYDESSDVALVKIEAEGLQPVSLGDSDLLVAGESVAFIGHPLGELTYSISKGIVAAVNREITVDNTKLEMFQIDAAVNSGNSGGPAFNDRGQVVGIVTGKYNSSSIEGLGFCVPINKAVKIANDLINYGFVRGQAGLGVSVKNVYSGNGYYQQNFGVQVAVVNAGSCAEKAGVQVGDIIIGLGGVRITTTDILNAVKSNYKMGETATLTLYRDGEELEVQVTFDELIPDQLLQTPSEA